jgi:hypothetical protein
VQQLSGRNAGRGAAPMTPFIFFLTSISVAMFFAHAFNAYREN